MIKKVRDPEKIHPRSGSRILDPWGKKAPDPGSATLGVALLRAISLINYPVIRVY
jgi:hypothetical protein